MQIKEDRWLPRCANCSVISPLPLLDLDTKVSSLIDQDKVVWKTKKNFWKGIWQLWVPNKIKHFVWRICNNTLPTMVNLHRRHIVPNMSCALCNDLPEDTLHAVWSCRVISGVWFTLECFRQSVPSQPSSFNELLSRFMFCQEEFRTKILVTIVWFLRNRRNAILFGRPALLLVPPRPPPMQQWRPPEPYCYKVNFDAAVFHVSSLVGIGVIIRNDGWEVVGALSLSNPMAQSVAKLEALACLKVVQFALEIGLT
ncbi:hypothetical protein ACB092_09G132900 [Castanea dentata]